MEKETKEQVKDYHYKERLYDRFINQTELVVGYEISGTVGKYQEVGTYILSDAVKATISENAKLIESYNFPNGKSYGIQLAVIPINKDNVTFYSKELEEQSKKKILLFVDKTSESNGNMVYIIIRDKKIVTVYFAKNYVSQDVKKLKVDAIIKNMSIIKENKVH